MQNELADRARQALAQGRVPWLTADHVRSLLPSCAGDIQRLLRQLVPVAAARAVTPISRFQVGAVGWGVSGAVYLGANWEPAAGPLGDCVHAEQSVIAAAMANGETGLESLAVSAPPCGHCRQFLWELSSADQLILLVGDDSPQPLAKLLPRPFGPADLGRHPPLLGHPSMSLAAESLLDPLAHAALAAAQRSYAPYSHSPAGIALRAASGSVVTGSYIENAAYNPSLSPVLAAIAQLAQLEQNTTDIAAAILVYTPHATIDHVPWAQRLLSTITPHIPLKFHPAHT